MKFLVWILVILVPNHEFKIVTKHIHLLCLQHRLLPSGEKRIYGDSLWFHRVSRSDSGTYICTADNNVGPPATASIDLNVICKLQVASLPMKIQNSLLVFKMRLTIGNKAIQSIQNSSKVS